MNNADLISLATVYDTLDFYRGYRSLNESEKKQVARQIEDAFKQEVVNYMESKTQKTREDFDYYIGLCERRILTIDTFNYATFMFKLMGDIGIFSDQDNIMDIMVKSFSTKVFGQIGDEIRWLERNPDHTDFKYRRQLAADCVDELQQRITSHYKVRNPEQDSSIEKMEKEFLMVSYQMVSAYYRGAGMRLSAIENMAVPSKATKTKTVTAAQNRNNLGNPFALLERLPLMSERERDDLKTDALANIKADGGELFDMIENNKVPDSVDCGLYMDNMESLMVLNDTPMFDSPVVHIMGVLHVATKNGGKDTSNKKLYGTLKDKIETVTKKVDTATSATTMTDVIMFFGIGLGLAALCAFLIFNPSVKAFFRAGFFYRASYLICAVIGIILMFTMGFAAFVIFSLVSAFIFGNLHDLIGIGVALKWIIILIVAGLAVVVILSAIGTLMSYMESKKTDFSRVRREAEEELELCGKYVEKCKTYLSKFTKNLEYAHNVGLCDEDRYNDVKELLPGINAYYKRAALKLENLSKKLG